MTIAAQAVLRRIGFLSDHAGPAAGYSFDFGNMRLQGMACMDLRFAEVLLFTGVWSDARTIAQVRFETPLVFDSYEQGVAWIAEGIGRGFRPASPVVWLDEGRAWRDHLPWVRQLAAYNARPRCTVERDWFRAPAARLRALAEQAAEADLATVAFDGHEGIDLSALRLTHHKLRDLGQQKLNLAGGGAGRGAEACDGGGLRGDPGPAEAASGPDHPGAE